jgi:5-methylcytosine-specific restriction endonuclease McrA
MERTVNSGGEAAGVDAGARRWVEPEKRHPLTRKQRVEVFMSTDGRCYVCGQKLRGDAWEAEHPQALALGGSDGIADLRPICRPCHKPKTADDKRAIEKCKRVRDRHIGAKRSRTPLPGSRASGWKRKMDGTVERRT